MTTGEMLRRRREVWWVRMDERLPKASVANVYDVQKVLRSDFLERLDSLSPDKIDAISSGLRLVLHL